MKPPPFAYAAPHSLEETTALLAEHAEDAKLLAGGQSLVPLLNMRLAQPRVVIDLNRVDGLAYIKRRERDGWPGLAIGATTRQRAVEDGGAMVHELPMLGEAVALVGHPQIRNRGTIGGSIAHADPAAELPLLFRALDGVATIVSVRGRREVAAAEFFQYTFTTALAADEVLVEVWLPLPAPRSGQAFVEVARRHGDFALVAAAVTLTLDLKGNIAVAQIGVGGAAAIPVRAPRTETALLGVQPSLDAFREAGILAAAEMAPTGDVHADASYRRDVAGTLVTRALMTAWERALRGDA